MLNWMAFIALAAAAINTVFDLLKAIGYIQAGKDFVAAKATPDSPKPAH